MGWSARAVSLQSWDSLSVGRAAEPHLLAAATTQARRPRRQRPPLVPAPENAARAWRGGRRAVPFKDVWFAGGKDVLGWRSPLLAAGLGIGNGRGPMRAHVSSVSVRV